MDRFKSFKHPSIHAVDKEFTDWLSSNQCRVRSFNRRFVPGSKDTGYPNPTPQPGKNIPVMPGGSEAMHIIDIIYTVQQDQTGARTKMSERIDNLETRLSQILQDQQENNVGVVKAIQEVADAAVEALTKSNEIYISLKKLAKDNAELIRENENLRGKARKT
jgi:hypothetical protein